VQAGLVQLSSPLRLLGYSDRARALLRARNGGRDVTFGSALAMADLIGPEVKEDYGVFGNVPRMLFGGRAAEQVCMKGGRIQAVG
jgi:hypothetical protein